MREYRRSWLSGSRLYLRRSFLAAIYFADSASKAINYSPGQSVFRGEKFLLLCEVALGNIHERIASLRVGLPKEKDSVEGMRSWSAILRSFSNTMPIRQSIPVGSGRALTDMGFDNNGTRTGLGKNRLDREVELDGCPLATGEMIPYGAEDVTRNYNE